MAVAAAAAALASPALARAGDNWYLLALSKNYSEAVYVDITSLKTSGTIRTAMMQTVERVSAEPGNIFANAVLVETDCAARTLKILKETTYNDAGTAEDNPLGTPQASTPIAGSRGELESKFVCSAPDTWDKSRMVDEGSVGGSLREYARFMLQGMLLDALNAGGGSLPK